MTMIVITGGAADLFSNICSGIWATGRTVILQTSLRNCAICGHTVTASWDKQGWVCTMCSSIDCGWNDLLQGLDLKIKIKKKGRGTRKSTGLPRGTATGKHFPTWGCQESWITAVPCLWNPGGCQGKCRQPWPHTSDAISQDGPPHRCPYPRSFVQVRGWASDESLNFTCAIWRGLQRGTGTGRFKISLFCLPKEETVPLQSRGEGTKPLHGLAARRRLNYLARAIGVYLGWSQWGCKITSPRHSSTQFGDEWGFTWFNRMFLSSIGAQSVVKEEFVSKAYRLWFELYSWPEGLQEWRHKG